MDLKLQLQTFIARFTKQEKASAAAGKGHSNYVAYFPLYACVAIRWVARSLLGLAATTGLLFGGLAIAQTTVPGTTPGQFGVSPSGAATYSIPIQVPPGIAGMQPKLSLEYNSQAGNGIMGMGWNLAGLSSITRCPQTMAQDGVRGNVDYTTSDKFCLDGQRLILVSGVYGTEGSEYRTEIESFSQIMVNKKVPIYCISLTMTPCTSVGVGPESFIVKTKAGLTMEYGLTDNSRSEARYSTFSNPVTAWALNKITDIKGNTMTVAYFKDTSNSFLYPTRIDYAGNAVVFNYGTTVRPDVTSGYRAGLLTTMALRLNYIATTSAANANVVKKYNLSYSGTWATKSTLSKVMECATEAIDGACMSTSVAWNTDVSGNSFVSTGHTTPWAASWALPAYYSTISYIDLNGDGLMDICGRDANGLSCMLNLGGMWTPAAGFSVPFSDAAGWNAAARYTSIQYMDLDGDGRSDMCARASTGLQCYRSNGSGWEALPGYGMAGTMTDVSGIAQYNGSIRYIDLNGDGRSDFCISLAKGLTCYLNTGSGWQESTAYAIPAWSTATAGWTEPRFYNSVKFADLSGDGLVDVCGRGVNNAFDCYVNTGSGWDASKGYGYTTPNIAGGVWDTTVSTRTYECVRTANSNYVSGNLCPLGFENQWVTRISYQDGAYLNAQFIDLNGDGLVDICARGVNGLECALNTGTSWVAAPGLTLGWADAYGWNLAKYKDTIKFIDLNGDGLMDVCARNSTGLECYYNVNGTWSSAAAQVAAFAWSDVAGWGDAQYYSTIQYIDVNGDGVADICARSASGVSCYSNTTQLPRVSTLTDNLGSTTSFQYLPLTSPRIYGKGNDATFPRLDLQIPLYVVSQVGKSNGVGGTNTNNYNYAGLKAEHASSAGFGRGMLGFRWMSSYNLDTKMEQYSEYSQSWPTIGSPVLSRSTYRGGAGRTLKENRQTYACYHPISKVPCPDNALGQIYFPYVASSTEWSGDLTSSGALVPLPTISTNTSYTVTVGDNQLWGDPSQITVVTSLNGLEQGKKVTTNEYNPAITTPGNWILGRLKRATVTSTSLDTRVADSTGAGGTSGAANSPPPPGTGIQITPNQQLINIISTLLLSDD